MLIREQLFKQPANTRIKRPAASSTSDDSSETETETMIQKTRQPPKQRYKQKKNKIENTSIRWRRLKSFKFLRN